VKEEVKNGRKKLPTNKVSEGKDIMKRKNEKARKK
jgi:hypothetical protein